MTTAVHSATNAGQRTRRTRWEKIRQSTKFWRGLIAGIVTLVLWEIGSRWDEWFDYQLPFLGLIPPPSAVVVAWGEVIPQYGYWESWYLSFRRVLEGFSRRHDHRHSVRTAAGGQPVHAGDIFPAVRGAAADSSAGLGSRLADFLAHQRKCPSPS